MSKFKLSDTLGITIDEADKLIKKYFKQFPAIGNFLTNLGNYATTYGHIKTYKPYRRIRWFGQWVPDMRKKPELKKEFGAIERAGKNQPIQGTGADMIKLSMIRIRDYIKENNFPAFLVTQVHDEIGVEVREDRASEWAEIQAQIMRDAGAEIIKTLVMDVEYSISKEWSK